MDVVNWIFVDLNSYFASVEQELQPRLRGRPIVVVPVEAETGCCIAVSYQAKTYGVRTGCRVDEARRLCPQLEVVLARPRYYVEYHHKISAAIERCMPVQAAMSCDEFACRLLGQQRTPERALEIAYQIKQEIRAVGSTLRCSVGVAPNRFLAKVAAEMQKPDGLMLLLKQHLPQSLHALALHEVPGIGRRMEKRLQASGITTMRELCALSRQQMSALWGSVWGDRLWLWLRGEDFEEPAQRARRSLSRQHILPPACRTMETARGIALKLLLTTARRMRSQGLWAQAVFLHLGFEDGRACELGMQIAPTQNALALQGSFVRLWERVPRFKPSDITVVLADLCSEPQRSFFDRETPAAERVTATVDELNLRFGLHTVYPGSIHGVRKEAPTRIAFGPPVPLDEFDDPADRVRPQHRGVGQISGTANGSAKSSSSGTLYGRQQLG